MKTALITGITGQDGRYLSKFLLAKGYRVIGLIASNRWSSATKFQSEFPDIELQSVDFQDESDLKEAITRFNPDEFYNLVAASSVKYSFGHPVETTHITALAPLHILEVLRKHRIGKEVRFYQASSSEMYGDTLRNPKTEESEFAPKSPYGIAKLFAHQTCNLYRDAYGMYISCGILFNHESTYRSEEYVSRKISREIARIAVGKSTSFPLGALTPKRDWGFAGDYVEAMWLMLQHDKPDDFVIATGVSHSVLDFVREAAKVANLPKDAMDYVQSEPLLIRPLEIAASLGDSSKARKELDWHPRVDFQKLVEIMVLHDIDRESKHD